MLINKYVFLLTACGLFCLDIFPTFAHKVKISEDVGAVLHIEPNDSPRAGEVSKVWLAMTRKGGKLIPLSECNCQLRVYSQPYKPGDSPLLQPSLQPLNVEKYQNTPSADVKFPQPGAYYLELIGKPVSESKDNFQTFKPFKLKFDVTVAAGVNLSQPKTSIVNQAEQISVNNAPGNKESHFPGWVMIVAGVVGLAVVFLVFKTSSRVNR